MFTNFPAEEADKIMTYHTGIINRLLDFLKKYLLILKF